jgi:Ca2+-binding EF-hand superfamily protein
VIFFTAVYLTAFLVRYQHFLMERHWTLAIATLLAPVYMNLVTWPDIIRTLNMVTSIGLMKHYDVIGRVLQEIETQRIHSAIKLMNNMRLAWARHASQSGVSPRGGRVPPLTPKRSSGSKVDVSKKQGERLPIKRDQSAAMVELLEVKRGLEAKAKVLFRAFDTEGTGYLNAKQLSSLLLGYGFCKHDITEHVDKYWRLDFDHVLALMSDMESHTHAGAVSAHDGDDVQELVATVFDLVDMDKSGSISLAELVRFLKEGMGAVDEDMLAVLLNEADVDGDGEVDKDELIKLLQTYTAESATSI